MTNVLVSRQFIAGFGDELKVVASTSLKCCAEMFIANFGHWLRGEPMFNVQRVE